jgi:hypothetical protein
METAEKERIAAIMKTISILLPRLSLRACEGGAYIKWMIKKFTDARCLPIGKPSLNEAR